MDLWAFRIAALPIRICVFTFVSLSSLPFTCTFVQLFVAGLGVHHICRNSAPLGNAIDACLRLTRTLGENECDALCSVSF
jgi:hypothetical protein